MNNRWKRNVNFTNVDDLFVIFLLNMLALRAVDNALNVLLGPRKFCKNSELKKVINCIFQISLHQLQPTSKYLFFVFICKRVLVPYVIHVTYTVRVQLYIFNTFKKIFMNKELICISRLFRRSVLVSCSRRSYQDIQCFRWASWKKMAASPGVVEAETRHVVRQLSQLIQASRWDETRGQTTVLADSGQQVRRFTWSDNCLSCCSVRRVAF